MAATRRSRIESLGVYLPARALSTRDVLQACRHKTLLPLEQLTGIKSRRIVGPDEFSIDLAREAVAACLARSRWHATDIDLVICCNISRYDGPGRFSCEPSTSLKLKKHFGFDQALTFDVTNACAGMFTGIAIVDALIAANQIRRGLVVSGEYLTHLTDTAQKEIDGFLDPRLACLTVGDAGAALILEPSPSDQLGFHDIELYTLSGYSDLCIAQSSEQAHGGAIMFTDMGRLAAAGTKHSVAHYVHMLDKNGWAHEDCDYLVTHQTSRHSLKGAVRALNARLNAPVYGAHNAGDNLTERGNTATTSHFVAIMDAILSGRLESGDKVAFSIFASGLTVGTALYTFDDLPDRLRRSPSTTPDVARGNGSPHPASTWQNLLMPSLTPAAPTAHSPHGADVRIESVALASPDAAKSTIALATSAIRNCLAASTHTLQDIGVLIFAGVYREKFLSEPAVAALIAGALEMHTDVDDGGDHKSLAFDVLNGGVGFLTACHLAARLIAASTVDTVMVVASEIENNATALPSHLLGLEQTGSAVILDHAPPRGRASGFGRFAFGYLDRADGFESHGELDWPGGRLHFSKSPDLEDLYIEGIANTVGRLLDAERVDATTITRVIPPQISTGFISRLSDRLNLPADRFVDLRTPRDFFTSSLPYGLQHVRDNHLAHEGDLGLFVTAGAGVQVGCALYRF